MREGYGTCVGATNDFGGPRLGNLTVRYREVIKEVNRIIRKIVAPAPFVWGSLQIDKNCVSRRHRDKKNEGLSLRMLVGNFAGGEFRMVDGSFTLEGSGRAAIIDGTREHESDEFDGFRY